MYSAALVSVLLVQAAFPLALATPFGDLVREVIDEANKKTLEKHLDFMVLETGFNFTTLLLKVLVSEVNLGNFSTLELIGEPKVMQVDDNDSTIYQFDLTVGLKDLELQLKYDASFLRFLSKSGIVSMIDIGDVFWITGVINTYTAASGKPCTATLDAAKIQNLGSVDISVQPSGFVDWILSKFISLLFGRVQPTLIEIADQIIEAFIVGNPDFQAKFSEVACKPFNS